ncbi:GntR family transcriptional regulator [Alkalihalobacillus pseudalcaliphilus]|uniref:GntR family transcriptional regulator n=1 Tax=Alkalihalobacillus pseudalcaliphilus TaxID=79884 RepID=UPI00064DC102|nr:GntR family transcriptional regulator [Alkalihalobacillus pseudalcaliphilus]KMK76079.1 GntR family transcriptional regulator [Alkalihalobacillus pseudalcaliphilus]
MNISRKKGPLYLQIRNVLKDRILHGFYPIGENIPSEIQLEEEFEVSKITIRNAIKELVQEGFLEKKSGKGTKVIRNTSASKLSKGKRFTEVLVEKGHKIKKKVVKSEIVQNEEDTEPYRLFGDRCVRVERIYYLNNDPYIHFTHYLSIELADFEESDLNDQSLYELLADHQLVLEKFRDEFAVETAPAYIADLLEVVTHTPLLKRLRYSMGELGDVTEYSVGYYNTNLQLYVVNYDA